MRVTYFLSEFPKLSETFILNQIEGLLDLGDDVRIVALARGDRPVHPAIERRGLLERTTYLPEVPASRIRRALGALPRVVSSPGAALGALRADRFGRLASSLELLYRATDVRDALRAEVVHAHYGPMGRLAVILRELGTFDAPVVTTFHGYDLRIGAARGPAVFEPLQRLGDAVIAISGWSRTRLLELGFDECRLVDHPVGVELDDLPARVEPDGEGPRLLSVARLVPEKGLDSALEALATLRRRSPEMRWRYRVVGSGPLEGELRRRIDSLGLADRVQLVGPADRDAVRRELAEADLFVLPSVAEVLPVALMEALASGLPAIASDVGAVREIVDDGAAGLLVAPGDATALAEAIAALLADPVRRRELGSRGRETIAARYSIEPLNRRLQAILERLVRSDDRRAAHA